MVFGSIYHQVAEQAAWDYGAAGQLKSMQQPPEWLPGVEFWLSSFWKLSSCRSLGMGEGPIPWTSICQYGVVYNMDEDTFSMLEDVIFELDKVYLNWRAEQSKTN